MPKIIQNGVEYSTVPSTLSTLSDTNISSGSLANGQVLSYNGTSGKWENNSTLNDIKNKYNCAGIQYCLARFDEKCQFNIPLNGNSTASSVTWNKSSGINVTIYGTTNYTSATAAIDNSAITNGILVIRLSLSVTLSQYTTLARGFCLSIDEQLLATVS